MGIGRIQLGQIVEGPASIHQINISIGPIGPDDTLSEQSVRQCPFSKYLPVIETVRRFIQRVRKVVRSTAATGKYEMSFHNNALSFQSDPTGLAGIPTTEMLSGTLSRTTALAPTVT